MIFIAQQQRYASFSSRWNQQIAAGLPRHIRNEITPATHARTYLTPVPLDWSSAKDVVRLRAPAASWCSASAIVGQQVKWDFFALAAVSAKRQLHKDVVVVLQQHQRERIDLVHGCKRLSTCSASRGVFTPARLAASVRDQTRLGPNTMDRLEKVILHVA